MSKSFSSLLLIATVIGLTIQSCTRNGVTEHSSVVINKTSDACHYNVQIQTEDITSCQEVYERLIEYGFNVVDVEPLFPVNERFRERHAAYGLDLWFNVITDDYGVGTRSTPMYDSH